MRLPEGYLMIDHRFSPGTQQVPEGTIYETKTTQCAHCGTIVIINPLRTRDREYCSKCDMYICDNCGLATKLPNYQHQSYREFLDKNYDYIIRSSNG